MRSATPSMGSLKPIHLRFGASVVLLSTPRGAARFLRWRVSQIASGRVAELDEILRRLADGGCCSYRARSGGL